MKAIAILKNNHGIALAVLTMLMAILTSMTGAALVFSRIDLMISNNFRKGTQALYAADAGISHGLNQLQGNVANSTAAITLVLGDGFSYRSSLPGETDKTPKPLIHTGTQSAAGYSLASGTGYNPAGYVFVTYDIHVTGEGPLSSARVIEAQGAYGPMPN